MILTIVVERHATINAETKREYKSHKKNKRKLRSKKRKEGRKLTKLPHTNANTFRMKLKKGGVCCGNN